jgi:hypothetical protein
MYQKKSTNPVLDPRIIHETKVFDRIILGTGLMYCDNDYLLKLIKKSKEDCVYGIVPINNGINEYYDIDDQDFVKYIGE